MQNGWNRHRNNEYRYKNSDLWVYYRQEIGWTFEHEGTTRVSERGFSSAEEAMAAAVVLARRALQGMLEEISRCRKGGQQPATVPSTSLVWRS